MNGRAMDSPWCQRFGWAQEPRTGKRDKVKEMLMGGFGSSRPILGFAAAGIFASLALLGHWAFLFLEMSFRLFQNSGKFPGWFSVCIAVPLVSSFQDLSDEKQQILEINSGFNLCENYGLFVL